MIAALLLAQSGAAVPPGSSEDVVVIAERLKSWSGQIVTNPLWTRCRTLRSTGDAQIDAIGCKAARACWPATQRGIARARDEGGPAADWQRRKATAEAALTECTKARRAPLIAALADARFEARVAR